MKVIILLALTMAFCAQSSAEAPVAATGKRLPEGFVYVGDVVPGAILEMRYYTNYNFMGERVDGYNASVAILTEEAARKLKDVSDDLWSQGYALKIFDAYRPQRAVDHFVRWAKNDDARMKEYFYPKIKKSSLFKNGYIAERSGHSRGSTIDLTLVEMSNGKEVDMGTPFDFFGKLSSHDSKQVTKEQRKNRALLKKAMTAHGFIAYSEEWWHYRLDDEPYPDTYFDFPVE